MSDLSGYGKIYESTYWGDGRDNTIGWGNVYKDLGATNLLDQYSGATAAYSVRKISSSYSGFAVKVRNKTTQTLTDIGFDSNGDIDLTALTTAANESGAQKQLGIHTWYDQSGNGNDATQTSASAQPNIFLGSGAILVNGKVAINFDGTNDFLSGAAKTTIDNTAIFAVIKSDSNTQDAVFIQNTLDANNLVALGLGGAGTDNKLGSRLKVGGSNVDSVGDNTFTATDQTLVSYIADNATSEIFIDGTEETDSPVSRTAGTSTNIGAKGDGNNPFDGAIQEVIFYDSDESSNRTAIETNINEYYTIF